MRELIEQLYENHEPPLLFMDGYDDCIIGVAARFNSTFVVYDSAKVIERLKRDGMTDEEALEFYRYNQLGGWHGESTPAFLERHED
jgi:hypothetical protein